MLASSSLYAEQITGKIVGVSDGDTVTLLDDDRQQHKIRLAGIDAPEKAQAYGQRSKQHLVDLIHGRQVTVDCGKVDKYHRRVCKVLLDGHDVNLQQIEVGVAWWYRKYSKEQPSADRAAYEAAELKAKNDQIGLWRDADPVPPWDWRRQNQR